MERTRTEEIAMVVKAAVADGQDVGVAWLQRKYRLGYQSGLALKQELCDYGVAFPVAGALDALDNTDQPREAGNEQLLGGALLEL